MKSSDIDDLLCLCTPLSCFQRKDSQSPLTDIFKKIFSHDPDPPINTFDPLEKLKSCYDEMNNGEKESIGSQINFISRLTSEDNSAIETLVNGIIQDSDPGDVIHSLDPTLAITSVESFNSLEDYFQKFRCLDKSTERGKLEEIVRHNLQERSSALHRKHDNILRRHDHLNEIMFEIFDNWRDGYFEIAANKVHEQGGTILLNKDEFKRIINSKHTNWITLIFNFLDTNNQGFISWDPFESQLENILQLLD